MKAAFVRCLLWFLLPANTVWLTVLMGEPGRARWEVWLYRATAGVNLAVFLRFVAVEARIYLKRRELRRKIERVCELCDLYHQAVERVDPPIDDDLKALLHEIMPRGEDFS